MILEPKFNLKTNNMKQLAVEFISKGLFDILQEAENQNLLEVGTQNFKRYIEMFEKEAKEIEKQQKDDYAIEFLDSIRRYERENGKAMCFDERDSEELLEIFKEVKGL